MDEEMSKIKTILVGSIIIALFISGCVDQQDIEQQDDTDDHAENAQYHDRHSDPEESYGCREHHLHVPVEGVDEVFLNKVPCIGEHASLAVCGLVKHHGRGGVKPGEGLLRPERLRQRHAV